MIISLIASVLKTFQTHHVRDRIRPQGQKKTCFWRKTKGLFVLDGVLEMWRKKQDLEYMEWGVRSGMVVNHMSKGQKDDIDLTMVRKMRRIKHKGFRMISGFEVA